MPVKPMAYTCTSKSARCDLPLDILLLVQAVDAQMQRLTKAAGQLKRKGNADEGSNATAGDTGQIDPMAAKFL